MDRLDGLALWLADHEQLAVQELHIGFCGELVARGIPLWRSGLGLELLHPEQSGERSIWRADGSPVLTQAPAGVANSDDYLNSPVRIVDDTDRPFRQRLDDSMPPLPLLEDMRREGGTDYVIYPLPFLDRTRSAYLSFATQAAEGFSEADIGLLETSARLLSPYAERRALRRIAVDLLDTYVGHHAGARIFGGQVLRGAVDTIEAAILMGDLRGFTAMSARRERPYVIETLNAWFDSLAVAIDAHDGEILKFMGDGLLAIFRADPDAAEACRRAFAATIDTMTGISAGNAERLGNGGMPIEFAMGLHVGEVAYGNVGGRRRMDFTVLGPAVNYASRLQDLAKRLNQPVLVSREFAAALPQNLRDLGPYPLRGIGASERVFAFPASVTANAST